MGKYILVVDDDALFTVSTAFSLQAAGYETATAANAEEAFMLIHQRLPDIILLDIGLPGRDGLEMLREVQRQFTVPIIFVTARRRELDEVLGLELGADDYITKPFDKDILLARIKAVLRRTTPEPIPQLRPISVGNLFINPTSHTVQIGEKVIDMPPKEFTLLFILASEAGQVVSVDNLINRAWGDDWIGETQTIYVHIRWIRERIEVDPAHPRRLLTIRGIGYKLVPLFD